MQGFPGCENACMESDQAVELADSILRTHASVLATGAAVERYAEETESEVARLWSAISELRDDLHGVANRVETLTRAVMAEPADVAQAIVNHANRSTLREVRRDES